MASRGDVLALKRRIGFGRGDALEHFVVLQSEKFSTVLETVIVAPLDAAVPAYQKFPGAVMVRVEDAATDSEWVVLVPFLSSLPLARFEAARRGRIDRRALLAVERVVRLLLAMQ